MYLKAALVILIILCVFAFPQKARAETFGETYLDMYFLKLDEQYIEHWTSRRIYFYGDFTWLEKCRMLFENLLEYGSEDDMYYIPEHIRLIDVYIDGGLLTVNVSEEIKSFTGAYTGLRLADQIIKTALHIPGIDRLSLLIENKPEPLPEGLLIIEETHWNE